MFYSDDNFQIVFIYIEAEESKTHLYILSGQIRYNSCTSNQKTSKRPISYTEPLHLES